MTWWLLLILTYSCPGGWFSGWVPAGLKPYVCTLQLEPQLLTSKDQVRRRLVELGPVARVRLFSCKQLRCQDVKLGWEPAGF